MKEDPLKQQYRELVRKLKEHGKKKGTKITNEFIAEALGYERSYFSSLLGERGNVTEKHIKDLLLHFPTLKEDNQPETKAEEPPAVYSQPIIQVVLNLSYTSKKNADSMDKMAATNQRNTEIIAALVSTLIPNSKLADQSTASPDDSLEADDVPPIEEMLGPAGVALLKEQWQAGKKKVGNR